MTVTTFSENLFTHNLINFISALGVKRTLLNGARTSTPSHEQTLVVQQVRLSFVTGCWCGEPSSASTTDRNRLDDQPMRQAMPRALLLARRTVLRDAGRAGHVL